MEKIHFKIAIIALCLAGMAACSGNNKKNIVPEPDVETAKIPDNQLVMKLDKTILNSPDETIGLTITNNSDKEIYLNEYYTIEHYVDERWKEIPLELAFIDIAYPLEPGASHDFSISLWPGLYKYKAGQYRVKKEAMTDNGNIELTATFTIK